MLVAPASALGKTRWVDDDGKAGSTSCSGSKTAYKTIQKGVNASGAGDTVKVCPGTYVGPVTIKGSRTGLILRSVTNLGATIKAKDEATFGTTYLVTIDGILATDGTTGTIVNNIVKDYRDDGIDLDGAGTNLTVRENTVTFAHLNFVQATGRSAILLEHGANGTVRGNTLNGPAAGGGNPQPARGWRRTRRDRFRDLRAGQLDRPLRGGHQDPAREWWQRP